MNIYQSSSSAATKKFAKEFVRKILRGKPSKRAVIAALSGELGAGKTTFAQGFAAGLGIRGKVLSPTFILMRKTKLKKGNFIHIDAYRAEAKNFLKLGFKEMTTDPKNIILIEWADKLKKIMPKSAIWIKCEHGKKENERIITMNDGL